MGKIEPDGGSDFRGDFSHAELLGFVIWNSTKDDYLCRFHDSVDCTVSTWVYSPEFAYKFRSSQQAHVHAARRMNPDLMVMACFDLEKQVVVTMEY